MTPTLYTAEEVAALLRRTTRTIQANCRAKKWEHTKIGSSYYFTPEQLQALINKGRTTPDPPTTRRARNKQLRNQLEGK